MINGEKNLTKYNDDIDLNSLLNNPNAFKSNILTFDIVHDEIIIEIQINKIEIGKLYE